MALVLDNGAEVAIPHLIQAFREAPPNIFKLLLNHIPRQTRTLWVDNDQDIRPLWIFTRFIDEHARSRRTTPRQKVPFIKGCGYSMDTKLEIILDYGEKIDEICGPNGNALQTVIYDFISEDRRTGELIKRPPPFC